MDKIDLFAAIGEVPDEMLMDVENTMKQRKSGHHVVKRIVKVAAAAACLTLAVFAGYQVFVQLNTITVSADAPVYTNLTEMTEAADYIVVAQCVAYDSTYNMARDPADTTQEHDSFYIEGQLYQFDVETVLKGEAEDTIYICYEAAVQVNLDDGDSVLVPSESFVAPETGNSYLLFLTSDGTNYYGIGSPFAVCLTDSGTAELQINTEDQGTKAQTTVYGDTIWVEYTPFYGYVDTISGMENTALLDEVSALLE